jgi:hypothetical protein
LADPDATAPEYEYRLVCSGSIHREILGDWSHSTAARLLVRSPVKLIVSSARITDYPAELTLRFRASRETIAKGSASVDFSPDSEIADDLCALLTLYCRRLVTVFGKTREVTDSEDEFLRDWPHSVIGHEVAAWPLRGASVIMWPDRTVVRPHDPAPLAMNEDTFLAWFAAVRGHADQEALLSASHLYCAALEHQWRNPEISYQLLVFAVEAVAARAFRDWEPDNSERLAHASAQAVKRVAADAKLDSNLSDRLALAAVQGNQWLSRKFQLFVSRYASNPEWPTDGTDDLHPNLELPHAPTSDQFQDALKRVYKARGGVVHAGGKIPSEAFLAAHTELSPEAFVALFAPDDPFPPLPWFERLVNQALKSYATSPSQKKDKTKRG